MGIIFWNGKLLFYLEEHSVPNFPMTKSRMDQPERSVTKIQL